MMPARFSLCLVLLLVPALFWIGCGGPPRPDGFPRLYPTTITVTQEGTPLEGALVALFSEDLSFKWGVAAITDASGRAEIKTHGQFSGAPLGTYKVVVTKTEPETPAEAARPDNEQGEQSAAPRPKTIKLYTLLEKQYTNIATTPLAITVESGKNNKTFDVGKPIREVGELFEL